MRVARVRCNRTRRRSSGSDAAARVLLSAAVTTDPLPPPPPPLARATCPRLLQELPDDVEMGIWDHLDEVRPEGVPVPGRGWASEGLDERLRVLSCLRRDAARCPVADCGTRPDPPPPPPTTPTPPRTPLKLRERVIITAVFSVLAMTGCFIFAKPLIVFLEAPVLSTGVRFLQLSPGEFFFTSLKTAGYCGLLLGSPVILYEAISYIVPGLTVKERKFLGPIVLGSTALFYVGVSFSYAVLTPAALNFFVSYAEGAVESLWSIDQYFEFVLVLMFSTGLSFQVPVIQVLLGGAGIVSSEAMLAVWRYVIVGAVIAAAVLTPSTDPLTQCLLAGPLIGLYFGGAYAVKAIEANRTAAAS